MQSDALNHVYTSQRNHMLNLTYFYSIMSVNNNKESSKHIDYCSDIAICTQNDFKFVESWNGD